MFIFYSVMVFLAALVLIILSLLSDSLVATLCSSFATAWILIQSFAISAGSGPFVVASSVMSIIVLSVLAIVSLVTSLVMAFDINLDNMAASILFVIAGLVCSGALILCCVFVHSVCTI